MGSITLEMFIRLAAFGLFFSLFALWELLAPRRALTVGRGRTLAGQSRNSPGRRPDGARAGADRRGRGVALRRRQRLGLIHYLHLRLSVAALIGFLALDLAIYLQHVVFHKVPVLWRLHRMHHADLDIDVTTGVRFHPFEILISLLIKIAVILALGIPVVAVILFEVVLNVTSMFNHSNVSMPAWLDRALRFIVVTPDMHRVHHSILRRETDSNFGFNLPWWDRLFGTYRAQPEAGHTGMTIGIPAFRDPGELRIDRMLTQPFRNDRGSGPD